MSKHFFYLCAGSILGGIIMYLSLNNANTPPFLMLKFLGIASSLILFQISCYLTEYYRINGDE